MGARYQGGLADLMWLWHINTEALFVVRITALELSLSPLGYVNQHTALLASKGYHCADACEQNGKGSVSSRLTWSVGLLSVASLYILYHALTLTLTRTQSLTVRRLAVWWPGVSTVAIVTRDTAILIGCVIMRPNPRKQPHLARLACFGF
jgi:hypothetical protein